MCSQAEADSRQEQVTLHIYEMDAALTNLDLLSKGNLPTARYEQAIKRHSRSSADA